MIKMVVAIKYIILLFGLSCVTILLRSTNMNAVGIGIAAAGCLIAYALIENNDVRESNKE